MIVKINQQKQVVELTGLTIDNQVVFNYFDNLPSDQRDEKLFRAIYIGTLALMEDRLSSFLSSTANELGTGLESLKMIFEMKKTLFEKSTQKGVIAENDIQEVLNNYFSKMKYSEKAELTGNIAGAIQGNKTGDIICRIKEGLNIGIECKFDKSIKLGDIKSKNLFLARSYDTAYGQLIETSANRQCEVSIIVFDKSTVDNSILLFTENVGIIPGVGIIAVIDYQKGDYTNLLIAYDIARTITLSDVSDDVVNADQLTLIVERLVKDTKETLNIKTLVEANISNNKEILKQIEKSVMLVEFNQSFLKKFLENGKLTYEQLLEFYNATAVNTKYKAVSSEIEETYNIQ